MESNKKPLDVNCWRGLLMKEKKLVCDIQSKSVPLTLPPNLVILRYESASIFPLSVLPKFELCPLGANPLRLVEWQHFLTYLSKRNKVAVLGIDGWELFINPPSSKVIHPKQSVIVSYRQKVPLQPTSFVPLQPTHNLNTATGFKQQSQPVGFMLLSLEKKEDKTKDESPKFARTHPSYMETLGQTHASWIFGAIAELVDNARDAGATRLDISIEQEYFKAKNIFIPVLCVIDNGIGMSHTDIMRMVSFGHKRPEEDDEDLIGRFGVGFKTGAMRLGKDVVVFTQSKETRSIAFFSRSFNEGKEVVEIPLITYKKNQGWMDFDSDVHSQEQAALSLKAVKDCSPFNEYSIGAKFEAFGEGTGTLVCIYNLDRWGSEHTLSWDLKSAADLVSKSKHDITIRSRRVRTRPAQMSREVPLDYSLHAYLEVMFLEPKMKIFVQGTPVKTRRLHKSLNKTKIFRDTLVGKKVELTLGCSQEERDRGNCGIFLYWHGRLIEAYKRVGGMAHTADMGRGVIGVVDVTDIMRLGNGNVAVLNNKQGFLDCEVYAVLEDWLGKMANSYWDENFDCLEVGQKDENAEYNPDHSWVQCNKCLKWRILDRSFNTKDLSTEWFCFMPPFKGTCAMVQQEVEAGVVTIGATRDCGSMGYQSRRVKEEVDQSTTATNSIVSNTECSDASVEDHFNSKPKESKGTLRRLKRESLAKDHPPGSRKTCKSS